MFPPVSDGRRPAPAARPTRAAVRGTATSSLPPPCFCRRRAPRRRRRSAANGIGIGGGGRVPAVSRAGEARGPRRSSAGARRAPSFGRAASTAGEDAAVVGRVHLPRRKEGSTPQVAGRRPTARGARPAAEGGAGRPPSRESDRARGRRTAASPSGTGSWSRDDDGGRRAGAARRRSATRARRRHGDPATRGPGRCPHADRGSGDAAPALRARVRGGRQQMC